MFDQIIRMLVWGLYASGVVFVALVALSFVAYLALVAYLHLAEPREEEEALR